MAAQVEVQTGEVGRTVAGGHLHLGPLTDSSNQSRMEIPSITQAHIITPEPNKPVPSPKPRLTPKPYAVGNTTLKPILAPKPHTKPRPESTSLAAPKPELSSSPIPQQPAATDKPRLTNPNRPSSTSFKTTNKLSTGQTTKPVAQPFKPAPPLDPGDPSRPNPPVPPERHRPSALSVAYSKSLNKAPAAEWSGTTNNEDKKVQKTPGKGGTAMTRAKSMGYLPQVGLEEEEKEKPKPEETVSMRPKPRGSRPRPVSAIFLESPTKTEAPVPVPRWVGRRPLSADLTSRFESIGLSLHRKTPPANPKNDTPEEKALPQKKDQESATPQGTDGVAKPAASDQSDKKTVEMTDEDKRESRVKSRSSVLLDTSSTGTTATDQGSDLQSPAQPVLESEPAVGVKQLIKQLTVDPIPTQSPVIRPPVKPRPLPLDLTKRFASESSDSTERHDLSGDPQRRIEESVFTPTPTELRTFVDIKEQLKKPSTPEGSPRQTTFGAASKETAPGGDVQTVRASLFENVVERHSVLMMDEVKPVNKTKGSLRSPSFRSETDENQGTLVTAAYKEPVSPSGPLRVLHAFDTVHSVGESRAVSESVPSAQWEGKAMTLRSRHSEGSRPAAERTGEPALEAQPRILRVGALPKWTPTGLEQEASTEQGMPMESQREAQLAFDEDRDGQRGSEPEEVAAAPKRLKMLQAEEQPKPRATYFALTGQIQEPVSPVEDYWSEGDTTGPFDDLSVRSAQEKILPVRRNPSLDEAFGKGSEDHDGDSMMTMRSHMSHGESRLADEMMEVEKKRELQKETERHMAKMKELEREKRRQLEMEKEAHLEFQRMKERDMQREFERQRQKAFEKEKQVFEEKQRALEREKLMELEKQRLQEMERERQEMERERQERERQRQLEKERRREVEQQRKQEKEKRQEQERERQREQERHRQREEERQRELDKERKLLEIQKEKQRMEELERAKEMERQQLLEFQQQKQKERERQQIVELEKQRLREKRDREEAEKIKQMALEQEMLRMRELEKEREQQRELEKERQKEVEREKMERQRQKQRDLERDRQRQLDVERQEMENQRQRQLDAERQEMENQRMRQRELEKERQRKEEVERLKEMERRQLLEFQKQKQQADRERQHILELETLRLRERMEKEEAENMRHIAKQQEAERQRLRERQRREEQERLRLESSALRPKVLDLDAVFRSDSFSKGSTPRSDPSTRWKEPSPRAEEPYKPGILDIDSFTSPAQHSPSQDMFPVSGIQSVDPGFGARSQPERDVSWKVPPPMSVGFTSPVWTSSPQDPWELRPVEMSPVEMSVDSPTADPRKVSNIISPEMLLLRQDERLPAPQRHRPTLMDDTPHSLPLPGTEVRTAGSAGGVSSSSSSSSSVTAEQIWLPRETKPQESRPQVRGHRRSQGAQELNRMRSRSMSRRSAPPSSAVDGPLARIRSRSAHREQDLPSLVQLKQSGDEEGRDPDTPVRETDSQYGTWETGLRTDDSLTPATPTSEGNLGPSPRKPTPPHTPGDTASLFDADTLDGLPPSSSTESQPLAFPDAPSALLDTSALRSRAQLGKKRAPRTRPTRAARQIATLAEEEGGTTEDWLYRDSTEAKVESKDKDSDSEEQTRGADAGSAVASQPQRVAMFPGMDHSALKAQLKKRGDSDNQSDAPTPSPSQLSRSPKSPFLRRAARVLPPSGGKENGEEESPKWLKELKSKKRLSQYENES